MKKFFEPQFKLQPMKPCKCIGASCWCYGKASCMEYDSKKKKYVNRKVCDAMF